MADLLVEIGCEELPAVACREAERQLSDLLAAALDRAAIPAVSIQSHVAPRRLTVIATGLPAVRPAARSEVRGPRVGSPQQALAGFARKHGVDPADLVERDGLMWTISDGTPTPAVELVPQVVSQLASGIHFSKSMRWEGGRFSRPVRWLVVKLDAAVVEMELFGLRSGERSRGHRFRGGDVDIGSAASYLEDLRGVRVVADANERRDLIVDGLDAGGEWIDPGGKLDEVVYLVEWPGVLDGGFDPRFLQLPDRVVVTAMQSHQRYFPLTAGGQLQPRFLFVANGGDPEVVVRGNREVLVGRLSDAEFAYRNDLDRGIEAMTTELGRVSFLEGSGSIADKTTRVRAMAHALAIRVAADADTQSAVLRAAELAKADLVSSLVGEFAELEGYAGSVYARAAGESDAVALAIAEHHLPYNVGGDLPLSDAGAILAIADKADTLAVALGLGIEPTGSRDPYGLRRAAAGLVAITLARGWALGLAELAGERAMPFVLDRLEHVLTSEGIMVEEVRAARGSGETEPVRLADLARGLNAAAGPHRDVLRDAYRRCVRILVDQPVASPSAELLSSPAEQELFTAFRALQPGITDSALPVATRLERASDLGQPLARYFDEVLVIDPDPALRANRLALVGSVAAALGTLGDFDQLPG
jgi:glycyl-tRNA synthetase beta chain